MHEISRWVSVTGAANGTTDQDSLSQHGTFIVLFVARIKARFGIDITRRETQQLSKARAGVLRSGVQSFTETVNKLLSDHPELKRQGLAAVGNWDETKVDLNKLLQGACLVPSGGAAQWEVEQERCAQITFIGGYMGHRKHESDLPRTLAEVRQLMQGADDARFDLGIAEAIEKMGTVAGYPKVQPGFWDGSDFCVLPGLLIFEGQTGADPAWLSTGCMTRTGY